MSVLKERGELAGGQGQRSLSILLLEDLMIVPLLAIVAFMGAAAAGSRAAGADLTAILVALGAIALVIAAGRWLLDPFFALLARARNTEVLTRRGAPRRARIGAADGAGWRFDGDGRVLAGLMLSGSSYRHQIESDVEPFKGLLMGLFFLAVGMSLHLSVVAAEWRMVLALLAAYVVVKSAGIYAVARLFGATNVQALRRVSLFAQGGEFAFVLYSAAVGGGVIGAAENAVFSSVIILSMALTPLVLRRAHFPACRLLVRSYDRGHSIRLRKTGVDFEIRETFESALVFGGAGLKALGMTTLDVGEVSDDIRRRDGERLDAQAQGGLLSGGDRLHVAPTPEPLIPRRDRHAGSAA